MPEPHARAYGALRDRTIDVVRGADPALFDKPAPATPQWRTRDVLAHMVGVTDDVVNGRLEGVATDAWTQAQVDARVDTSVDDMLTEWVATSEAFDALLTAAPEEIAGQALFDAVTHEHDLRNALDAPSVTAGDAVDLAWDWIVALRTRTGMPAIVFVTETGEFIAGTGEPRVRVEATRFELLRAVAGRRCAAEIARYGWDPEPDAELLLALPDLDPDAMTKAIGDTCQSFAATQ